MSETRDEFERNMDKKKEILLSYSEPKKQGVVAWILSISSSSKEYEISKLLKAYNE